MKHTLTLRALGPSLLATLGLGSAHAGSVLNTADPTNGIYDIYSATFDGALVPCPGSTYCDFFGGDPGATRSLSIAANPTGVVKGYPGGIGPSGTPAVAQPGAGSWLNLTLTGGNTSATLTGGTLTFGDGTGTVNVKHAGGADLDINTHTPGLVIADPGVANANPLTPAGGGSTGRTVPIVGNIAVWEVQQGGAIQGDFSRFSQVYTSCAGAFCPLVTADVLNLDVVRYVLVLTFNPTFTSYTGTFVGETSNNSLLYINMNSNEVASTDTDGDGIPDAVDNCSSLANANQRDTGFSPAFSAPLNPVGDGYGNLCDPDLNNDGTVNINDFNRLKARLGIAPVVDVDADLDGNGAVNINDLNRLKSFLGKPPGPSGLHPNCPPTCP